ncbi:acyl-CoA dehydrogenase family protein [Spirillospora sp. NPDC050679]
MADLLLETANADALWGRLADSGRLRGLYRDGDPALGLDAAALRALFARLDADEPVGATLGVCVQSTTALPLLAAAARRAKDPAHPLAEIVRDALAGRRMIGLAATDVTPGSDLAALTTTVTLAEDHLTVTGRKEWIANAVFASHLLVLARHGQGRGIGDFTWVVVPADAPGVTVETADAPLFDGSGTGHASFREVTLPLDHLGGAVGRGLIDFSRHISVERLASAAWGHAMCRRVLRETVAYLRERGDGPDSLWAQEEVRRRVAECLTATAGLGALIDAHADAVTQRHDHLAAALLKADAARTVEQVVAVAAHLQGARAFAAGGLQTLRAQAGLWSVGGGTYEVMLSTIADHTDRLLDAPA